MATTVVADEPRLFYAIRRCDSLNSPAIFTNWDDCSFYVDQDENDGAVDYKVFETVSQAVAYIIIFQKTIRSSSDNSITSTSTKLRAFSAAASISAAKANTGPVAATPIRQDGTKTDKVHSRDVDTEKILVCVAPHLGNSSDEPRGDSDRKRSAEQNLDVEQQPASKKRKSKWDSRFDEMLEQLKQYKATFGTTSVSTKGNEPQFQKLARWVLHCRKHAQLYKTDPQSTDYIDSTRWEALQQLGFMIQPSRKSNNNNNNNNKATPWRPSAQNLQRQQEYFEEMFQKLQAFHNEHGHANVPAASNPRNPVRSWIDTIRKQYQKFQRKETTTLTLVHIGKLTQLGFQFTAKHRRRSFEERAQTWLEFRTKHGRDPRQSENNEMCKFIWKTRRKYNQKQEGQDTNLTQEQIDQLTNWGFQWKSQYKTPNRKNYKSWEERFQELVSYKQIHGDCLVPQTSSELGSFVHQQRIHYKKFIEGKKSILNPEKIEKLKGLDFVFLTRRRSQPKEDVENLRQFPPATRQHRNLRLADLRNSDGSGTGIEDDQEETQNYQRRIVQQYAYRLG